MNQRAQAALILLQVTNHHRSLSTVLRQTPDEAHALTKELCYGTLRHYHHLLAIAQQLLHAPLKEKDKDIMLLIVVGVYQILFLNVPDYAAVSETVDAAKQLKKKWATGLVNKVLHRVIAEKASLIEQANQTESGKWAHPDWFIQSIQAAWPDAWTSILDANNTHPPLFLRVNPLKISTQDYLARLEAQGITAYTLPNAPYAIRLAQARPVQDIPGFAEGLCSIQDASGQRVVELMDLQPDQIVLDACAAPGGKTSHILELEPKLGRLIAIDKDAERLLRIKENITRLQLAHDNVQLKLSDATHTNHWWDGKPVDRILLDAPCSGTGVIRRHPDIKVLRHPEDIEQLKRQQLKLLTRLWPLLAPGGKLIYSTCSILPAENEQLIESFVQTHKDAKPLPIEMDWGIALPIGHQLLPEPDGPDGFYYAILQKKPSH